MMTSGVKKYFESYTQATTLAFFRLAFGLLMLFSTLRFVSYGWVEKLYLKPSFHFTYFGFEWVKPIGNYTYLLFGVCAVSALFVAVGYKYKWAIVSFFLSFTYIELLDKTTYLNHYYFVSIVSFLLIFLPANCTFSVDAYRNPKLAFAKIPRWNVDILKLMLGIVYFYAGLAKLNSDWLCEAMPLKIWLPAHTDLPLIGSFLNETWAQYAFSWAGAIYDLSIPFLLLYRPTRIFGFSLVVVFHVLTKILFPIGVFPYVMIVSTLIFFDAAFHQKCLLFISRIFKVNSSVFTNTANALNPGGIPKFKVAFLAFFMMFQLALPFRYLLYPDELFWTEEGFRFSWRVMLMEKAGYTQFTVRDPETRKSVMVDNSKFLNAFQEKQMSFQPDFILEYAHFLHDYYKKQGMRDPQVYVESYVALNGRLSRPYINPKVNLAKEKESFRHKTWILPFDDEIKGF